MAPKASMFTLWQRNTGLQFKKTVPRMPKGAALIFERHFHSKVQPISKETYSKGEVWKTFHSLEFNVKKLWEAFRASEKC